VPALEADGTEVRFEYSPESFTGTELDYALEVCQAVTAAWNPSTARPIILNLPATVEMATPNVYADQIEWMHRHLAQRERIVLSVHPHNDRGTAVAAAELAVMAGADRIEGTLFGNGERTGNVDLVTLALNLFSQGIDPGLDLSDLDRTAEIASHCSRLPIHPRHPYVGTLVYTAFSGSHQDAIKKGMAAQTASGEAIWEVPYLPIDPGDVGRSYEAIIRVNSQSGKGGVAWIMEQEYGIRLPRGLQAELSAAVQGLADRLGEEIPPETIWHLFDETFLARYQPLSLVGYQVAAAPRGAGDVQCDAVVSLDGRNIAISGQGTGPIDAFAQALERDCGIDVRLLDYQQHAVGQGSDARAICFVELSVNGGRKACGAGLDQNVTTASLRAMVSGINRLEGDGRRKRRSDRIPAVEGS
jgi:2-isopropylmalate synthase